MYTKPAKHKLSFEYGAGAFFTLIIDWADLKAAVEEQSTLEEAATSADVAPAQHRMEDPPPQRQEQPFFYLV